MSASANDAPVRVAGLLVQCRPQLLQQVHDVLEAMDGVEVHQQDDRGVLVVTAEALPGEPSLITSMEAIGNVPGVLATSLVYHHEDSTSVTEREIST